MVIKPATAFLSGRFTGQLPRGPNSGLEQDLLPNIR
jgi:hypothetical protein